MSAKYKSPSFLLPNELNTSANTANDTGINSLYSMDFDGSQYVDTNFTIPAISTYSFSLWFKTPSAPVGGSSILSDMNSNGQNLSGRGHVGFYNNFFSSSMGNGTNYWYDISSYNISSFYDNNWHNIVLTINNYTQKLYIDGSLVYIYDTSTGGGGASSAVPAGTAGTQTYKIARAGDFNGNYFDGQIDEVAIFNRALDDTERAALYDGTGSNIRPSNLMATDLNPIAYYPLGEQAQNSGYPGSATPANNVWQFPNGVLQDYVMDFDGSNQYINAGVISALSNVSEYSISLWANIDTGASGVLRFFGNRESSGNTDGIGADINLSTSLYFYLNGGPSYPLVQVSNISNYVTAGTWFNLVCTFNTGQAYVFIDGVQRGSGTGSSTADITTNPLYIGADPTNTGSYFDGQISNFVLWSSDQSANIANIYNNGSPQTSYTVTPQNWWKLNADSVYTPSAPNYTTALDFNGSSDYISLSNNALINTTSPFTISGWFNLDSIDSGGYSAAFAFKTNSNHSFLAYISNQGGYAGVAFGEAGSGNAINTSTNVSSLFINKWANLTITYNGSGISSSSNYNLYINGQAQTLTSNTGFSGYGNVNLLGYYHNTGFFNGFNGSISNVAIHNSALSASQVSTLFNFGTPETAISFDPTAWWKLNDQTAITDSSGNGNTGTNNGAANAPGGVAVVPSWKIPDASGTSNGVSTTLPSTALQQSDLQFDSPYSNYSLSFDGNSYIDTNFTLPASYTSFSYSFWFKRTTSANPGTEYIISNLVAPGNNTQARGLIRFGVTNLRIQGGDGTSPDYDTGNISATAILDQNWHHISVTFVSGEIKTYFDGSLVNTYTNSLVVTGYAADRTYVIGQNGIGTGYLVNSKLDEFAIFNKKLTEAEILSIYNNGRPGDISPIAPTNWWRLGENAYFVNNDITLPNSVSGAPNGVGSGTVTTMLSADAPGTYANGIGDGLAITDRVGDAPLSVANSQSYNMIPDDKVPYVPGYVGAQTNNVYSMTFDGVGDYFESTSINALQNTSNFSISFWVNFNSTSSPTAQQLVSQYSSNNGITIEINAGVFYFVIANGSVAYKTFNLSGNITAGTWYHICMNYDNGSLKGYLNGLEINLSGSVSTSVPANTNPFYIGKILTNNSLNASIDEVAIFDKALTPDQIKFDLYEPTALVGGVEKTADIENNTNLPTPVAWYRMGD